eukprot:scaffold6373_cov46-Cyclotella_meneghiniana.AAC.1
MLEQEVMNAELKLLTDEPRSPPPPKNDGEKHRRLSGYNSAGSGGASFTSSFLGGLEEDMAIAIQDDNITDGEPEIKEVSVTKKKEHLSSSFTTVKSSNGERVSSTAKSDGNTSSQSSRRQPFDNPFRSQKQDIFNKKDDSSVSGKSTGSKSRGASSAGGRSVSFSSKEPHQYDLNQATYPRTVPKKKHEDNSSVDTFSLGSLGSLAVTASTRSSLNSHITKNTRTSRSSRSSRSSHTSGASTQSSGSARERRQRRELQPVKNSSSKSIGSNTGSFSSLGSGSRRRKKSGGGSKGTENGSASKARNHGNLHSHHPTRYPKRSGLYDQIDEDAEYSRDEAFDELYGGLAASGSDDEGLFRRVEKVKQTIQNGNAGILDSLLESQPLVNNIVTDNDDDNQSLGEKSFLSDFLNNRVAQNGTTKQRKGGSSVSKSLMTSDSDDENNNTFKDKCQNYVNNTDIRSLVKRRALTVLKAVQQWNKEGYLLPTSRIEFIKYGVLALILAPIFHVAIAMALGGGKHIKHSGKSVHASSLRNANNLPHFSAIHTFVMLSSSSSVRENFVLVPDTEWVNLPPKPPTRVALPSRIDHGGHEESAMILLTISASKENNSPSSNTNANTQLWDSIRNDLRPKPLDAWPSWYHDSALHIRDDGFTLMYPSRRRDDAISSLMQLAEEFGQTAFYEFVAWDETSDDNMDIKVYNPNLPPLPRKQTDMMIRRTIRTSVKGPGKLQSDEILVMRRVQDLPIEDDLTLRDYEGPDDVIWNKPKRM